MTQRSRGWCFTINNDNYDDMDAVLDLNCIYLCFGFEKGSKNKTRHIQGYAYFSNARTLQSMKRRLVRAHLEPALGSDIQNRNYCKKEGDFYEFGDLPSQGQRNDLEDIKNMIDKKKNIHEIIDKYPSQYMRYHSGIEKIIAHHSNSWSEDNHKEPINVSYIKHTDLKIDDQCFIACCEKDLVAYNLQETLIIYNSKGFNTHKLELLSKHGIPYLINNGYIVHKVRPLNLIFVNN